MKSFFLMLFISASALFCETVSKPLSRMVTPNGDGRNDNFIYKCYNPRDLGVTGEIFDLNGRKVSEMSVIDKNRVDYYYILRWSPGGKFKGGVYLYQITLGEHRYRGTFALIR